MQPAATNYSQQQLFITVKDVVFMCVVFRFAVQTQVPTVLKGWIAHEIIV